MKFLKRKEEEGKKNQDAYNGECVHHFIHKNNSGAYYIGTTCDRCNFGLGDCSLHYMYM